MSSQFRQDETEHHLWQRDRIARVVREDLRDLEHVREVSLVEQLVDLLPSRVGSPLSASPMASLSVDWESKIPGAVAAELLVIRVM
jgi:hypothetical protein